MDGCRHGGGEGEGAAAAVASAAGGFARGGPKAFLAEEAMGTMPKRNCWVDDLM